MDAVLLAWAAAAMGATWSRWRARRRIARRIGALYELILTKAEAARAADYAQPPPEAFALYHALRTELFEFGQVGGAIQTLKGAIVRASAETPAASDMPVKGAAGGPRPGPPVVQTQPDPRPGEVLRAAVNTFCDYWSRRAKVEADLRGVLMTLGVDAPGPTPIVIPETAKPLSGTFTNKRLLFEGPGSPLRFGREDGED